MNATDTIKEALREYVGDGDGADEKVLAEHDAEVARRLQADLTAHVDQATGLAYFLAEQMGEHVDDQGDETQIQTVLRLLSKIRTEAAHVS